jgi:redox-sensitive bicupin YhaK (pirin superfamily)
MAEPRKIRKVLKSKPTVEGAGVHLQRAFGFTEVPLFDPFLLFDDFRSDKPEEYLKGFPWHPHRGIETITYVLAGDVEHGDSMGNKGTIGSGDVQWMTAGSGIIHQEMPKGDGEGRMLGFQLWANLPKTQKMMDPRYRDIKADLIPEVVMDDGTKMSIIAGRVGQTEGPVKDIVIEPEYLDVSVPPGSTFTHPTKKGHNVFAYVIGGKGRFSAGNGPSVEDGNIIIFEDGLEVAVTTGVDPVRFLLISGRPLGEPVAWSGPIVMNTQEELKLALEEYRAGTFVKHE